MVTRADVPRRTLYDPDDVGALVRTANRRVSPARTPGTSIHWPRIKGDGLGGPAATTRPPLLANLKARGRICSSLPAQRATTASNLPASSSSASSARIGRTCAQVISSSRTAARRNEARRCLASNRLISTSGRTIAIGIPGRPAPAPKSRIDLVSRGSSLRNSRLSRNRCSTIQSGSVDPINRYTDPHSISRFRYLRNVARS